ncbi:glycosyltransferase [Butyrivibrio sp. NC3005]|uniref:glycosyltransferase n=1 Tax=Butyrivibrio sp. NC3005 TaxID=1280685 RepID=UPI00047C44CE|nr:glycosyltransferase [Butyrivibrio sp. NC3005]
MRITAITLGSYGDIMPFMLLGQELIKRGYKYRLASFESLRPKAYEMGLEFSKISGDMDELVGVLLGNSDNTKKAGMNGLEYLISKYPGLYDDLDRAVKDSDVLIYMQFGAIAYHFAQKYGIEVIRSMAFPFENTKCYAAMMDTLTRNSIKCYLLNVMCEKMMAYAVRHTVNDFRKRLGLKSWNIFKSYKKLRGKRILTLYQFDEVLADRDKKWKDNIYLTGNWIKQDKTIKPETEKLLDFIDKHEKVIYVGFGSMNYAHMDELYARVIWIALHEGRSVILPKYEEKMVNERFSASKDKILLAGFTPYEQFFDRLECVIHHGGNGTVHACLRAGVPQLVMVFGADQAFWGGQCYYRGLGPKPVFIKKPIDEAEFREKVTDLMVNDNYKKCSQRLSNKVTSDGLVRAADIIERRFPL